MAGSEHSIKDQVLNFINSDSFSSESQIHKNGFTGLSVTNDRNLVTSGSDNTVKISKSNGFEEIGRIEVFFI